MKTLATILNLYNQTAKCYTTVIESTKYVSNCAKGGWKFRAVLAVPFIEVPGGASCRGAVVAGTTLLARESYAAQGY